MVESLLHEELCISINGIALNHNLSLLKYLSAISYIILYF